MSEVSSSGGLDEKEQISVPKDLFHDFESLKNVTNLTTVDLMRRLLGEYQTIPDDGPNKTSIDAEQSQYEAEAYNDVQSQSILDGGHVVSGVTSSSRLFPRTALGRSSRKSGIPGQKLKQVCEILHCKNAAREMEQRKLEASERNCNSAGSSSSGTVVSMEEPVLVNCDFQPVSLESVAQLRTETQKTSQAPFAHTNNNQDAVHLRKLLGTKPNISHADSVLMTYSKVENVEDMVLDLSVNKSRDCLPNTKGMTLPTISPVADEVYDHRRRDGDNSVILDMVIRGKRDSMPEVSNRPQLPSTLDLQRCSPMYLYSSTPASPVTAAEFNRAGVCNATAELPQVPPPLMQTPVQPDSQGGICEMSRNVVSRMRTRARRQVVRKAPVNEGMKLINENNLYPGVYTSTFKLPGSRRGRRSAAPKQVPQQAQSAGNPSTSGQPGMMISAPVPNGSEQPYMMVCPQVAVSSVLVKSPRKRGRPPKRPTISQFQCSTEQTPNAPPVVLPQSHMTISVPTGGNPGMVSSDNGSVSYLYQPQADQTSANLSQQLLQQQQQHLIPGSNATQVHPNHNQLVSILNQATSINACNPVFVPNSSLHQGIPTALPTNAAGIITLPLQNVSSETKPLVQGAPTCTNLVTPSTLVTPGQFQEEAKLSPLTVEPSSDNLSASHSEHQKVSQSATTTHSSHSGVFQEMILSPQSLVSVKPRSKPTTTELIRSNSNFYCGSFKIRPQKPNTQTGQGTPLKRGRGRPRLNVFESSRQKETKESRSKMYQELFHCKVCNEIVSAGERLSHQRKHVSVKLICPTCGIEFQTYKNSANFGKDFMNPQCSECKKMYEYDMNQTEESTIDGADTGDCESSEKVFNNSLEDGKAEEAQTSENELVCQLCGNVSYSSTEYAQHLTEHEDDMFTCFEDGCCQRFRNGSELRRHVKHSHVKGKEHPCVYDGCDKTFMKNFHLQEHIRVKHFNIKAFKCPWPGCQKEFSGIRHLKVHMLIHKGEKPLKCEFCDYRCRQRNALNWHMRKHTEVSPKCNGDRVGSESDPEEEDMVIDMGLLDTGSSSNELSSKGYEPEIEDGDTSPEAFPDFSPINEAGDISCE